jgi:hypothetical protein
MPPKRKRAATVVVHVSHCTTCRQPMDETACAIDWHAAYVCKLVEEHMARTGRIPTHEELQTMDEGSGSDPCDDCCCGACGSRKTQPGVVCC